VIWGGPSWKATSSLSGRCALCLPSDMEVFQPGMLFCLSVLVAHGTVLQPDEAEAAKEVVFCLDEFEAETWRQRS
jgi:hypothetical protein